MTAKSSKPKPNKIGKIDDFPDPRLRAVARGWGYLTDDDKNAILYRVGFAISLPPHEPERGERSQFSAS
jgi:hypothetical protein